MKARTEAKTQGGERSLLYVAIGALAWAAMDAFVFGQGMVALGVCVAAVVWFLPRAAWAWKDDDRDLMKLRLAKAAVVLVAGLAALAFVRIDNAMARDKADQVIKAVETYKQQKGRYPARLEDAMPSVPSPRIALLGNRFWYASSPLGHSLTYATMPPFGRRMYSFEERRWHSLD